MRGISIDHPHPRPCLGRKKSRKAGNKGVADNVILIDIDPDEYENIIIIDPESLPKKSGRSSMLGKEKNWPSLGRTVIYLDDDESTDDNHSGIGDNENSSFSSGATGRKKSTFASKGFENAADTGGEECQFVQENATPVKLSKCKRTYSEKASTRRCYTASVNPENDYPDCELMEDSSGKLQKQWENAFFRRKKDKHDGKCDIKDCDGTSRDFYSNHHHNVREESKSVQHEEAPFCSTSKCSEGNEAPSPFITKEDALCSRTSNGFKDPISDDYILQSFQKSQMQSDLSDIHKRSHFQEEHPHFNFSERQASQFYDLGSSSCHEKGKQFHDGWGTKQVNNRTTDLEDVEVIQMSFCNQKASSVEEEALKHKHQNSFYPDSGRKRSTVTDTAENFQESVTVIKEMDQVQACEPGATSPVKEKDNLMSGKSCSMKFSSLNVSDNDDVTVSSGRAEEAIYCKNSSPVSGDVIDKSRKSVSEMTSTCNMHPDQTQIEQDYSCSDDLVEKLTEPLLNSQRGVERVDQQQTQHGDSVENCIINEREKLKETDEYKKATEEEWASRQLALQIQAAEAQRLRQLRKREKAESMRLLDMERRQKQRLQEIRDTQKKDVENMNLKETIRTEVRAQLKILETTCHDMASLLHSLGIQMTSWPHPSSHEVQTAYKRALLTFHPDRAMQSDLRQQVEAEEKFKLINRLKDKFSASS